MSTETRLRFQLIDRSAATDATGSSDGLQPFSNMTSFIQELTPDIEYGTLEPEQCILDGSRKEFPDVPTNMGLWTLAYSA